MNMLRIFKSAAIIAIAASCADAFAYRTLCTFSNSTLRQNEVLLNVTTNLTTCPASYNLNGQVYALDDIANVQPSLSGEKIVCGGYNLPAGYTAKRHDYSSSCPNKSVDALVVNKAPTGTSVALSTPKNTLLTGTIQATDLDGDALTFSTSGTQYGATLSINATTGVFSYTPPTNFQSEDTFIVTVTDKKSDPINIFVSVRVGELSTGNRAPVFNFFRVDDVPKDFQLVMVPDVSDPDGDNVTISLDPTKLPLNGTITKTEVFLGKFYVTYKPNKGYTGPDSLSFVATDTAGNSTHGTYPLKIVFIDTDGDGMPDWYERSNGLNMSDASDATLDPDYDQLSNLEEFLEGTNRLVADSDSDGIPDGYEVKHDKFNPLVADSQIDFDLDGYTNLEEYKANTNPNLAADNPKNPLIAWLIPILHLTLQ